MAVIFKTEEEIELLRQSNLLVSRTHAEVAKLITPGVSTLKLDKVAEEYIRDNKGIPAFLGYKNFPNTLCVSINSVVVHGIPSSQELRDGDIISVDCGAFLNGFCGDSAYTYSVGNVEEKVLSLLRITKESLYKGIENAIEGKRLGDIGWAIQNHVTNHGYSVVREMVGHGVGRNLHEDPIVQNYGKRGDGLKLKEGMVLAIEPMINLGKQEITQDNDGWTVRTVDGKHSAHFEHSVAIRKNKAYILSTFEFIEEVLNNKK